MVIVETSIEPVTPCTRMLEGASGTLRARATRGSSADLLAPVSSTSLNGP